MFKNSLFSSFKSGGENSNSSSNVQKDAILEQLVALFPNADQEYLKYCIGCYQDNHVERISEKIFNQNKGHYPKIPDGCKAANCTKAKNAFLLQINELFPECDVGFLRDKLCNVNHSHLQQIIEQLLNMERTADKGGYPRRMNPFTIEPWELIRSPSYRKAVRYKLYNDFPDTWRSTIKAVLAENNFDYKKSLEKLKELATNNWWNSLFSVFRRKLYKEVENIELMEEIQKLYAIKLEEQSKADYEIAKQVNFTEYTKNEQLITCGCCYGDYPFEDLTCCNEGHLFCKDCINHLVQEGLFGQGSLRGKQIKCIEPSGCDGYFTDDQLNATLSPDIFKNYLDSLIEHSLKQSNLSLVQCPFCTYCEADDDDLITFKQLKVPKSLILLASLPIAVLPLFTSVEIILSALNVVAIFILPQIVLGMMGVYPLKTWIDEFDNIVKRVKRRRRGNIFKCQNPVCGKVSCLLCNKECRPFHKCYEQEQDSLRLFVEKAMAEAVKRTCPKCHVSFTKADGCNKMTCRCGYVMCYLCRKDLRQESYAHFCDHFRPIPGQKCKKCNKCDLYKTEDEEKVIREAATKARNEFLKSHPEARDVSLLENTSIGPVATENEKYIKEVIEKAIEKVIEYLLP
ncbi:6090_t:CDS:2 [Funneliformis mosseae]|uniref:6090_t:CDS:1 n=1 Tax=Funneliformis mosseae TaxID=27381 RepID=A0A9N9FBD1_FUNMO|nr:6090_t:CDS:2 [Funneliformis mosseae]